MPAKQRRVLTCAILLTLTVVASGTWWISQDRGDPSQPAVTAGAAPAGMERPGFIPPHAPGPVKPVVVDLAKIAPGQFDPNNKFTRWQQGKADFSERERIVSEAQFEALQRAGRLLPPSLDVQIAQETVGPSAPSAAFDSIDYTQCCGGGGNVPPDPEMAAGPNHLIAVVNVAFEIYNKTGSTLKAPTTLQSFMGVNPSCTNLFDPNALYDEKTDHFILGAATQGGYYCAAVSLTGDPMGSWYVYAFPTASGSEFFDYPHAGVGDDAIYVGSNIFKGQFFSEGRIFAFDKTAMYAGQSAQYASHGLGSAYDTPQPLNLHGWNQGTWPNPAPHQFLAEKNYNGADYAVLSWTDPFGANVFSEDGVVDLNVATGVTAGMPNSVPQSGSGTLDSGDWRPLDFEYHNGSGWTSMTIACNPGSGTVNCVRWAQIDLATATVADAGVYASDGIHRTYGDLAVNACGDMAVGYTKSSSAMYPAIWFTGRQAGDRAGTLQDEVVLKAGELAYTAFDGSPYRWGDYTGMTIDPNGDTFWYLGEYAKNTGTTSGRWGTYIGSFSFGCDGTTPPDTTPPVRSNGQPTGSLPSGTTTTNLSLSTDENATCKYDTVAGTDFGSMAWTFTVTGQISHQTGVDSLVDGGSYTYYVRCQDTAGNPNTDDYPISFSVAAVGTPPSVTSIDFNPAAIGGSMSGTVTVTAQATDDSLVTKVEFFVDNVSIGVDTDGSNGWSATWDTTSGSDGAHTVKAVATDDDNTTGDLSVDVTVDNGTGAALMHIGNLDGAVASPGRTWAAEVTATVLDSLGQPVSGATVSGEWTGDVSDSSSCVTDVNGTCTQSSIYILKKQTSSIVFMVADVTKDKVIYDPSANTDPDGDSSGTAIQVNKDGSTQNPGNQPPVADFSSVATDLMVQFTDLSADPDGSIVSWSWDFGDGNTSIAQSPSHTYGADGNYPVSLTVTDDNGASATAMQTVAVGGGSGAGVTAHVADLDDTSVSNGGRWDATVTVTVLDANDAPVAGANVSASWTAGTNGNPSCTTDGTGQCDLVKRNLKNNVGGATLEITNITDSSGTLTYDAAANGDPDGDSDGTTITVSKP